MMLGEGRHIIGRVSYTSRIPEIKNGSSKRLMNFTKKVFWGIGRIGQMHGIIELYLVLVSSLYDLYLLCLRVEELLY